MELTGNTFFFSWETSLILFLQSHMGSIGTAAASFFTLFGEEIVSVVILGFLYWCWNKEFGRFVGLNVLVGATLNPMIKNVFLRKRPYFDNRQIQCLRPVEADSDLYDIAAQGYSFPSGHSTTGAALYGSLFLYRKKKQLLLPGIAIPLLIGVSRFCLGVHYPTDVLCGWLLGIVVIFAVPALGRVIPDRRIYYGVLLLVTVPGIFYCRSEDYFSAFGLLAGFVAANLFEERYVRFRETKIVLNCIVRLAGGILIFLVLNAVLKAAFGLAADGGTTAALLLRSLRYAVIIFLDMGVYPMLFKRMDRVFDRS